MLRLARWKFPDVVSACLLQKMGKLSNLIHMELFPGDLNGCEICGTHDVKHPV